MTPKKLEGLETTMGTEMEVKKVRGLLDGVPVDDKTFPLHKPPQGGSALAHWREIVGSCPRCGAPIYGKKAVTSESPEVRYSCDCRLRGHPDLGARTT